MTLLPDPQCPLPDVMIDYLHSLVLSEMRSLTAALVECRLEIGQRGGRPVQEIVLFGQRHTVFGFPPVQCRLLVLASRDHCRLYLSGEGGEGAA